MSAVSINEVGTFKAQDYKGELRPVWCPGCGDYGVLAALYKGMAELQLPPWNTCVVSGIGCSSRLPGYVTTFGFNSVHGRALPVALGMKVARPDANIIAVGGDGDGLAIGGNHFLHACRRNTDLAYFVMDNEIYGLTKGQASPATPCGDKTKSTIYGNPEPSIDPCELALSCGATWVGRAFSGDLQGMTDLMVKAMRHRGFAFLNIMSPCVTWRGDDQYRTLRSIVRKLPTEHDVSSMSEARRYVREKDVMTVGLLYQVQEPSLLDRIAGIERRVGQKVMTTADILETYGAKKRT